MSTTSVTGSQGPALSEEGAITRFLRATELDTRTLGMVAALLVIWAGFDIYGGMVHYYPMKMPGQPTHTPGPGWIPDVLYPHVTYTHGPAPGPVPLPKA